MIARIIRPAYIIGFLILFYSVGIAGLLIPAQHDLFARLTPFGLLLNLSLLLLYHPGWNTRMVIFGLVVFFTGFLIEAVGVATGSIFGSYAYSPVMGFRLWDTPLIIGVNWLLLIYTTWDLVGRIRTSNLIRIFMAAALMVIYDLFLEPAAIKLDLWSWDGIMIPLQNYFAWFIISFLFFIFASLMKIKLKNRLSISLWFILLTFFILLNLFSDV